MGYNPNIPHLYVGYNPSTNQLTSWNIRVGKWSNLTYILGMGWNRQLVSSQNRYSSRQGIGGWSSLRPAKTDSHPYMVYVPTICLSIWVIMVDVAVVHQPTKKHHWWTISSSISETSNLKFQTREVSVKTAVTDTGNPNGLHWPLGPHVVDPSWFLFSAPSFVWGRIFPLGLIHVWWYIYLHENHQNQPNVGNYIIHRSYGFE